MSEVKVSELPEASSVNDEDLIMIVQNNINKKVTGAKLYNPEKIDIQELYINGTKVLWSE